MQFWGGAFGKVCFFAVAGRLREDVANDMVRDMVKTLAKVALLRAENRLTAEASSEAASAASEYARELLDHLYMRSGTLDPHRVCARAQEFGSSLVAASGSLMRERNWRRAARVVGFFGSEAYVSALLNAPELEEARVDLRDALRNGLLKLGRLSGSQLCSVPGCQLPRARIPGAVHCHGHHALRFTKPPTLEDFLGNTTYLGLLRSFLLRVHPGRAVLVDFITRAQEAKMSASASVRNSKVQTLYRKYIAPEAPHRLPFLAAIVGDHVDFEETGGDEDEKMPPPPKDDDHDHEDDEHEDEDVSAESPAGAVQRITRAFRMVETAVQSDRPCRRTVLDPLVRESRRLLEETFEGDFKMSLEYEDFASKNLNLPLPQVTERRKSLLKEWGVEESEIYGPSDHATVPSSPIPPATPESAAKRMDEACAQAAASAANQSPDKKQTSTTSQEEDEDDDIAAMTDKIQAMELQQKDKPPIPPSPPVATGGGGTK